MRREQRGEIPTRDGIWGQFPCRQHDVPEVEGGVEHLT